MKKLDKLILKSFLGPFLLTFLVVVFILLTQYMLKYFDDFVGKDLGFSVFSELIFYFSINMTTVAFPLAVLLSSLITFGNLGEHFELTAIKSAGISLLRAMRPIFFFVIFLSVAAYYSNNYIVPKANLNAYSLLYDIKEKKPSLDLKEGAFYGGIPNYSIKVNKKYPDDVSLGDIIIYNHSQGAGNKEVILADSGRMYTILDDQYLIMELYHGESYDETESSYKAGGTQIPGLVRDKFERSKMIFSLASFKLQRTDKELFSSNRMMKNNQEIYNNVDSMGRDVMESKEDIYQYANRFYTYAFTQPNEYHKIKPKSLEEFEAYKKSLRDTLAANRKSGKKGSEKVASSRIEVVHDMPNQKRPQQIVKNKGSGQYGKGRQIIPNKLQKPKKNKLDVFEIQHYDSAALAKADSVYNAKYAGDVSLDVEKARFAKNRLKGENRRIENRQAEMRKWVIEAKMRVTQAWACIVMFLIGAPLGAIIKRGGLGMPVLLSILFFIISYVFTTMGIKLGRAGDMNLDLAAWMSNLVLLPIGFIFLYQARNDSRLFDVDAYFVFFDKIRRLFVKKKG